MRRNLPLAALVLAALACARNPDAPEQPATDPALEALYLTGQQQFMAGDAEKAAETYRQALRRSPSARGYYALGDALLVQARFGEAADAFAHATRLDPSKRMAWLRLGRALVAAGRSAEAVAAFDRGLALGPPDAGALREKAEALAAAKQPEEAIAAFGSATGLDPGNAPKDLRRIGQIRAGQGRYAEAAEALSRSAEASGDAQTLRELGDAQLRAGDLAAAGQAFARAGEADDSDAVVWEYVGEIELKRGRRAQARDAFERALRVKASVGPHLALGRLDLKAGERAKAKERFQLALASATGEQAEESRDLAEFALLIGDVAAAEKLYAMLTAEEEGSRDAELWRSLAAARARSANAAGARQACERAKALLGPTDKRPCPPRAP